MAAASAHSGSGSGPPLNRSAAQFAAILFVSSMEDICIVCAEPLAFTAFGPCGHKDACSKCVLRLRGVLQDPRCLNCQVPCEAVFIKRYQGDYTEQAGEFAGLAVRSLSLEVL